MGWGTIGLSVMATQASAITFLSMPGQAYTDGMGFIQIYFGMPFAIIIIAAYVVPLYHKLNVYLLRVHQNSNIKTLSPQVQGLVFRMWERS